MLKLLQVSQPRKARKGKLWMWNNNYEKQNPDFATKKVNFICCPKLRCDLQLKLKPPNPLLRAITECSWSQIAFFVLSTVRMYSQAQLASASSFDREIFENYSKGAYSRDMKYFISSKLTRREDMRDRHLYVTNMEFLLHWWMAYRG